MIRVYGAAEAHLELALEHINAWADRSLGRWNAGELIRDIIDRRRQIWVIDVDGEAQGFVLTRFEPPNAYIDACSGRNRKLWQQEVDDTVCAWARSIGAQRVICLGRRGWSCGLHRCGTRGRPSCSRRRGR